MKKTLLLFILSFVFSSLFAQVTLTTSPYIENFNGIGSGLPAGFTVRKNAGASSLGTSEALTTAATAWNNTSGAFKNFASATAGSSANSTTQATATDRALGLRPTGSFGDPGGAFVFQLANTTGKTNLKLSFDIQSLDASSPRVVNWRVDYGTGAIPSTFTAATATGTLTTGNSLFLNNAISVDFGSALDNNAGPVWIRIVAINASTGSNNRPSTAIDNFNLTFTSGGAAAPTLSGTPTSLAFGNQALGTISAVKSYVLSGRNLTNPANVTVTAPFSISKDNITFSSSLSFTPAEATADPTVYVRFSPTVVGNTTTNITHVSTGAITMNIALTGTGIDPTQTAFKFEQCTIIGSPALSDGFYQYSVTGAQTWGCVTSFGHDENDPTGKASLGNAVQINGYSGANILNEDWLISPALNISAMNYAVLSFWTRSAFAGDRLQLKISTNYSGNGDPNLATWTTIDGKFPQSGSDVWTKSDYIDLSAYKATPIYVAFVYNSTTSSASRWTVDDFAITNSNTVPPVDISTSPTSLNFGFQSVGTTSTPSPFSFSAGNLTGGVTLTAPANFVISKTSNGAYTTTLTYSLAEANNTSQTVYAQFAPTVVNKNYNGNLVLTSLGSINKSISLIANTFDVASSLEVVNWNIEWFGSPAQNPSNDALQAANVKTIINNLNADLYGLAEVVDTTLFRNAVLPAGYNVIFSEYGSYADNKNDTDYPLSQKLAFMYRTDLIKPIKTYGVLQGTYNPADPATSIDGTPYKNWSSGRFPFAMEAEVTINGKKEVITFIELHAKANTGTDAAKIDSYYRRKDGNKQLKDWLDANLAGKKVMIMGDFNDVLDYDKTIAPMPTGTVTSYTDFMLDPVNYFPITLPLSLAGKRSTGGFPTVIDNTIINKELNVNYIPGTTEVLDGVRNLVTSYSTTTTDHYPIKSRYYFGNSAPTLGTITDVTACYSTTDNVIALNGISAGSETAQTTSLNVTSDNSDLFDLLTVQAVGADKGTITYRLKNNVSGTANITVTVMDDGDADFGGVNSFSKTFKLTVDPPVVTIGVSGTTVLQNATAPVLSKGKPITLTASGAINYVWTPNTDVVSGLGTANLTVRPKQTTTYTLTGTNASGCTSTTSITIQVSDDYQIKALNMLTPNGDGKNDKFVIENIDYYPNNTLKVFDRSGRIVYTKKGYANEWEGTFNGSPLASDTYYYIIDFGANIAQFKGYITLIKN